MSLDRVGDGEVLYRNVRLRYCTPDETVKVRSEAFFDPQRRPSVDRAELCSHDPAYTRRGVDGVVSLVAREVRAIDDVLLHDPVRVFMVDVEPRPLQDNPAHAQIYLQPESNNDRVFRRLRISLARLANTRPWAIRPEFPAP